MVMLLELLLQTVMVSFSNLVLPNSLHWNGTLSQFSPTSAIVKLLPQQQEILVTKWFTINPMASHQEDHLPDLVYLLHHQLLRHLSLLLQETITIIFLRLIATMLEQALVLLPIVPFLPLQPQFHQHHQLPSSTRNCIPTSYLEIQPISSENHR